MLERTYYDPARAQRPLTTAIWWPDTAAWAPPHPVILLSHGTGGSRFSLTWLAEALAAAGYVVAAPDHFGNSTTTAQPAYFVRYWERPLDLQVLLDRLLAAYGPVLDATRVGAAGFSFGGYTVLALAGATVDWPTVQQAAQTPAGAQAFVIPEMGDLRPLIQGLVPPSPLPALREPRVAAVLALAPALGLGFKPAAQPQTARAAVRLVAAAGDTLAPAATNAARYRQWVPDAEYATVAGGHYVFLPDQVGPAPYFEATTGGVRTRVHEAQAAAAVRFFDRALNR
ncbi:alpha/beta hydrolase family protein [Lacticaseibacillus daqingensis]|uniref:alpha/beta hydrolase family protein n=1 Tax=Lacticaseibacillus daqingensis TaxID=2486014 RepID=UPI000F781295|nr:dienelactone hydrolase family protein [Lacticaseibacillus daqingensis]